MTWWWLASLLPLWWLVGYWRRRRNPLTGQSQIRYVFRSRIAFIAARMRGSKSNYAVTIGRHCFVRLDYIRQEHCAHEYRHAVQSERIGPTLFVLRALYEYARHGYLNSPIERDARAYAADHAGWFVERRAG